MKVIAVRTYHAIGIGGPSMNKDNTTFVSTQNPRHAGAELELLEGLGIKLRYDGQVKVIPFSNVSEFHVEEKKKPVVKKKEIEEEVVASVSERKALR